MIKRLVNLTILLDCCDQLIMTSTGPTLYYNSHVLGTYISNGIHGRIHGYERISYKNDKDNDSHLSFDPNGQWMVCT